MTKWFPTALLATSLSAAVLAPSFAEDIDIGKAVYQLRCAECHGDDAKGRGPFADQLKTAPAD
jgi:mono/diheme cytochrome c family protein